MSIKNRIKKIESEIIPPEPQFCGCYQEHWQELIGSMYGGIPVKSKPPDLEKGVCDRCRKPFSESDIQLERDFLIGYGGETATRKNQK